jgi:hypothetical protein
MFSLPLIDIVRKDDERVRCHLSDYTRVIDYIIGRRNDFTPLVTATSREESSEHA